MYSDSPDFISDNFIKDQMNTVRKFIIGILILVASQFPAPSLAGQEYTQRKDFSFDCASAPSLYFDLFGDSVDISTGQTGKVEIKAMKSAMAPSRGAAQIRFDHLQCEVVKVKDIIYVKGVRVPLNARKVKRSIWDRLLRIFEAIDDRPAIIRYVVTLPAGSKVKMTGNAGKVSVSGLSGGILLQARTGEAVFTDNRCPLHVSGVIERVRISNHSGPIELSGSGGEAVLSGIRGSLSLNWKAGKFVATSVGGAVSTRGDADLLLDRCAGTISVKSTKGSVRVTGHSGKDVTIATQSGNIFLDTVLRDNKISLDTVSGDVEFSVSAGTRGIFDFDTGITVPLDLRALKLNITEMEPKSLRGWVESRDGCVFRVNCREGRIRALSLD
ncbi:MAG: hypothetical protein CVV64_17490 [Candidatus Wallbacteria bacterium HGW-Wallbacteria-1]|uniref:DUF4097 domain-containing protein n=1 Tax=Candidatus Wallbacteria bacterium HGW-Wallbacteria-1 TaxID=2013854 RepID=A0A2N1PK53_9BACT|nr:MAG: hypothetical protein CVV64_17490 [Candidatus Wallbacteria bacterium HGW-Wallbacteria-1]